MEAIAGQTGKDRRDVVVRVECAGQLIAVGVLGDRRDCLQRYRVRRAVQAGQHDAGDCHVLLGDVLDQPHAHARAGIFEHRREIARCLPPLLRTFLPLHTTLAQRGVDAEQRVVIGGVPIRHLPNESRRIGRVIAQIRGATARKQPVVVIVEATASSLAGQHTVDPEIIAWCLPRPMRDIGRVDPCQLPAGRKRHRGGRHRVVQAAKQRLADHRVGLSDRRFLCDCKGPAQHDACPQQRSSAGASGQTQPAPVPRQERFPA